MPTTAFNALASELRLSAVRPNDVVYEIPEDGNVTSDENGVHTVYDDAEEVVVEVTDVDFSDAEVTAWEAVLAEDAAPEEEDTFGFVPGVARAI